MKHLVLSLAFLGFVVSGAASAAEKAPDLDFQFLHQLAKESGEKNVVISSTNLEKAFQILALGADGATKAELDNYLSQYPVGLTDAVSTVRTALCLWTDPTTAFDPAFVQKAKALHQSAQMMQSGDAAGDINGCVSKATEGQIKNVLPPGAYKSVLSTALYFKGKWQETFDKSLTKDEDFRGPKGEKSKKPFMRRSGKYRYAETERGQMVQIPYEKDGLVLTVYLPDEKAGGVEPWLASMNLSAWREAVRDMGREDGQVVLPKIDVSFNATVNEGLASFGLKNAFARGSLYPHILSGEPFRLDRVLHQTAVRWDEEATEASAATTMMMDMAFQPNPKPPFNMVVDHPFFFTIGNRNNSMILFSGIVNKP